MKEKRIFYQFNYEKAYIPATPLGLNIACLQPPLILGGNLQIPLKLILVWNLMYWLRFFKNRKNYAIFVVDSNSTIIHYSVVLPWHRKYRFMGANDCQIGPCWTHPDYRGQGVASTVYAAIICSYKGKATRLWYITRPENLPSARAAEKAGLKKYGEGYRLKPFGLPILGGFFLERQQ